MNNYDCTIHIVVFNLSCSNQSLNFRENISSVVSYIMYNFSIQFPNVFIILEYLEN